MFARRIPRIPAVTSKGDAQVMVQARETVDFVLKREALGSFRQNPFLQTKKEKGRRHEPAAMKMPELRDENMTLSNGLVACILSKLQITN